MKTGCARLSEPQGDWRALPFRWTKVSGDLIAQRPLTAQEQGMRYLQKIEKNGAYLRAAVAEKLGGGTPVHLRDPERLMPVAGKGERRPGVWRVTITPPGAAGHDGHNEFPCAPWDGGEWMVTPIVTLLRALE